MSKYCAVQLRVPVRVTVLSNSTGAAATGLLGEVAGSCSYNSVVRGKDSFQVDLRVHGVSQDVIHKDKKRMTNIKI